MNEHEGGVDSLNDGRSRGLAPLHEKLDDEAGAVSQKRPLVDARRFHFDVLVVLKIGRILENQKASDQHRQVLAPAAIERHVGI